MKRFSGMQPTASHWPLMMSNLASDAAYFSIASIGFPSYPPNT